MSLNGTQIQAPNGGAVDLESTVSLNVDSRSDPHTSDRLFEALDWDPEHACDSRLHRAVAPSDGRAGWLVYFAYDCACVPRQRLWCDECLSHVLASPSGRMVCLDCGLASAPGIAARVLHVERIR